MSRRVHIVRDVDPEAKTGVCSYCGPVRVKRKKTGWRCWESERRWSNSRGGTANWYAPLRIREQLLEEQEGRCAICKGELTDWCLDHCHVTGTVRGVLCPSCNLGLGHFRDDAARLASAAEYIAHHGH